MTIGRTAPDPRPTTDSPWITTYTGRKFHLLCSTPDEVCLEDVARALSRVCRFGGHTREFYSVAEHSVLVSLLVRPELAAAALLHDAHEAYFADLTQPLKWCMRPPFKRWWDDLTSAAQRSIHQALGVPEPTAAERREIRDADIMALAIERRDLIADQESHWPILDGVEVPAEHKAIAMSDTLAFRYFCQRWHAVKPAGAP